MTSDLVLTLWLGELHQEPSTSCKVRVEHPEESTVPATMDICHALDLLGGSSPAGEGEKAAELGVDEAEKFRSVLAFSHASKIDFEVGQFGGSIQLARAQASIWVALENLVEAQRAHV